jgi:hypothetical protein
MILPGTPRPIIGKKGGLDVSALFAPSLYTGNGTGQDIVNGIDLASGGAVLIKPRTIAAHNIIANTLRGAGKDIILSGAFDENSRDTITSFNANGFSVGAQGASNSNGASIVSYSFKKAERFFDIVSWVGNSTAGRQIPHSLGVEPGMIVVKYLGITSDNFAYHKGAGLNGSIPYYLKTNTTDARVSNNIIFPSAATDQYFTIGANANVNANGVTYLALIWAHDENTDGVVRAGSYLGNGSSAGPIISLGWQPQFLLIKSATSAVGWTYFDTTRGLGAGPDPYLFLNTTAVETSSSDVFALTADGFQPVTTGGTWNNASNEYTYLAIRAPD